MYYDDEKRLTRITVENRDNKWIWETPYNDTSLEDMLNSFYGICVAMTYSPSTVLRGMKEFAEELLPYTDPDYAKEEDGEFTDEQKD